jgi:hypothetical protein
VQRLLQSFSFDPVSHSEREFSDDAGVIDVTDGRVVQPAQRFRLAEKPGPDRRIGVEVDAQTDAALEDLVVRLE